MVKRFVQLGLLQCCKVQIRSSQLGLTMLCWECCFLEGHRGKTFLLAEAHIIVLLMLGRTRYMSHLVCNVKSSPVNKHLSGTSLHHRLRIHDAIRTRLLLLYKGWFRSGILGRLFLKCSRNIERCAAVELRINLSLSLHSRWLYNEHILICRVESICSSSLAMIDKIMMLHHAHYTILMMMLVSRRASIKISAHLMNHLRLPH